MSSADASSVSVIVCTYTEARWEDLCRSIRSVLDQGYKADVIVVVDHNPALLDRVRDVHADVRAIPNVGPQGLSGARNSGIASSSSDIVAFLDDDASAEPFWLERLVAPYSAKEVIAVGGRVQPAWDDGRPAYFPEEFDWVVGCTYRGMPEERATVRNLIGANMSFRRDVFAVAGDFVSGLGRVGSVPLGCEETELCIRARRHFPHGDIVYEPSAVVHHRVFRARGQLRYFFSRCAAEGRSKAMVATLTGAGDALSSERAYAVRVLPAGIARGLWDTVGGRPWGLARAAVIVAGVTVTALNYARGRLEASTWNHPDMPA